MPSNRFFGRRTELRTLDEHLRHAQAGVTQFIVAFGRRRAGKTFLLREFARTIEAPIAVAYYAATRESVGLQREAFARSLADADIDVPEEASGSWGDLFGALFETAREQTLVITIDEAPYLIDSDPAWPSLLQREWDRNRSSGEPCHLMLVLNGSAISAMTSMIASSGALFERPTGILRIDPFDLPTSHAFLGHPDPQTTMEAYAACGGYPLLLERWDIDLDAIGNLTELGGEPFGPLAANASTLLLDLADIGGHRRVLGAIGRGATKLSEINNRAGQRSEHSINVLEGARFIGRRTPIGEPPRKNVHYDLTDGYLRFWFQLIDRNMQLIESGQGAGVMQRSGPLWIRHLADSFEREARSHAVRLVESGELDQMVIGEWWTDSGQQAQLDVVGLGDAGFVLVGEVKWRTQFTRADVDQLDRNIRASNHDPDRLVRASWSIAGATDDLRLVRPEMRHFTIVDMVRD